MLFCVLCTYFSSLIKITLLVFLIVYDHCSKQRREIKKKKKASPGLCSTCVGENPVLPSVFLYL